MCLKPDFTAVMIHSCKEHHMCDGHNIFAYYIAIVT